MLTHVAMLSTKSCTDGCRVGYGLEKYGSVEHVGKHLAATRWTDRIA